METAVGWMEDNIERDMDYLEILFLIKHAKEMEKKEKLKHQLFIGKVSEILGFDKTVELLKECNNEIL